MLRHRFVKKDTTFHMKSPSSRFHIPKVQQVHIDNIGNEKIAKYAYRTSPCNKCKSNDIQVFDYDYWVNGTVRVVCGFQYCLNRGQLIFDLNGKYVEANWLNAGCIGNSRKTVVNEEIDEGDGEEELMLYISDDEQW